MLESGHEGPDRTPERKDVRSADTTPQLHGGRLDRGTQMECQLFGVDLTEEEKGLPDDLLEVCPQPDISPDAGL